MIDLAADRNIFVADFGETLRFRANSDATPSSITANVNRNPVEDDRATPIAGSRMPRLHIMIPNGGDSGVAAEDIVAETSEIEVAAVLGATPRWRVIDRIIRHNAGAVLVEVTS